MLSLLGSLRRGNFVQNSLRFRSSASAYLSRTFAAPTSSTVFTWSAWVKRGALTGTYRLFGASTNTFLTFNSSDQLNLTLNGTSAATSTAVFRDSSAWYHIVYAQNGAAQTLYVNQTSVATGTTANTVFNTAIAHQIGAANTASFFDGYLTEVNFIDGQALTPSSFGQIETTTGVWSPKQYVGSYGTNGFYLKFGNTSSVAALGTDSSGNNNTWTVNNVSLTAGATYDSMLDVPVNYSDSGNGRGNYATLNPTLTNAGGTSLSITSGNLNILRNSAGYARGIGTLGMSSGKWYFEFIPTNNTTSQFIGVGQISGDINNYPGFESTSWGFNTSNGNKTNNAINTAYGAYAGGQTVGVAVDMNAGNIWFSVNGTWQASGNPETGANPAFSGLSGEVFPQIGLLNVTTSAAINFGQRPFTYTPPAGFRALNTNNLPTPSIVNGANFMAATTYTGNGAARSLSNAVNNVSFQPDLVWIKSRTPGATNHALFDSSRGVTKYLSSNTTTAETTLAQSLTALNADGFSLGTDTTLVNASANSYVAWQWKAGGAAVSNTQGTITSQVSANTTAGFSVVTWTGNKGTNATVGHGLGVVPRLIITKARTASPTDWPVYHANLSAGNSIFLSTPAAQASGLWYPSAPSSTVFTTTWPGNSSINASTINYVSYIFAEIAGFSKFGNYTGNGLADGPFVFCGFRPRFVMVKAAVGGTGSWTMIDTSRDVYNLMDNPLFADLSGTETPDAVNYNLDGLSNGFKLRTNGTGVNASGVIYIFAAFAEVPSKYALAR